MINLTKDNLYLLSRVLPGVWVIINIWLIIVCIGLNFIPLYIAYTIIFCLHWFKARVWRWVKLNDASIESAEASVIILKDIHGQKTIIKRTDIVMSKTSHGITDVTLTAKSGGEKVVYVMLNDILYRKYFEPVN